MATSISNKVKREDFMHVDSHQEGKESLKEERLRNHIKIKNSVIIETFKMLICIDAEIPNIGQKEESPEDFKKLAEFLSFNIVGETIEELKQSFKNEIDQNIDSIVNPSASALYFEFFNQKTPVYLFSDFIFADDLIPKRGDIGPKYFKKGQVECLGTGEYPTDEAGNRIPHDKEFVKTVLLENIHFHSHLLNTEQGLIYDPGSTANINLNWFENDRIHIITNLEDGFEWDLD